MSNFSRGIFTLIDPDPDRRAAVTSLFQPLVKHVVAHAHIDQLISNWPLTGIVLVHDSDTLVEDLQQTMRTRGYWRTHVAFREAVSASRVVEAVLGGAIDYLDWPLTQSELVSRMQSWRSRSGPIALREVRRMRARKRIAPLSRRETQFLKLLSAGKTGPQIGELLGISTRTVEIHRANALKKMKVRNAAAAVRIAVEAELWLNVPLGQARGGSGG